MIASKTSACLGVPSLLLFLGIGMLAGTDGLIGIEFDDFELARNFGIIALAHILFLSLIHISVCPSCKEMLAKLRDEAS